MVGPSINRKNKRGGRGGTTPLSGQFWLLFATYTGTNLADGITLTAFPLLAIGITDDARLLALVTVFRFLPFLVVGLPAGVFLDRADRRLIGIFAQLLRAAVLAGVAFLVATDTATIAWLCVAGFIIGVGEVLTDGGLPALVRNLVKPENLEVANSRFSATENVTNVFIGPPLGALAFDLNPVLPFAAAAVLFLLPAALLAALRGDHRPVRSDDDDDRDASFLRQMGTGLRYVWRHPVIRPLALAVGLFSFVGSAGSAIFVLLATERFGLSNTGYGFVVAIDGVVAIIASFFVAGLVRRTSHSWSMRFAVITYAIGAWLYAGTTTVPGIVSGSVFAGLSNPTWNVNSGTIRQRLVPDAVFGRMMTAYLFIAWSLRPLGAYMGGEIAQRWGPQWVFALSGTAVASLLVVARPMWRAIDDAMGEPHLAD